jgi:hypothetical protein
VTVRITRVIGWGTLFASCAGPLLFCGGKFSPGYFDNDGGFHSPDGAFVFGPGSSCTDYDAGGFVGTEGRWGRSRHGDDDDTLRCGQRLSSAIPRRLVICGWRFAIATLLPTRCCVSRASVRHPLERTCPAAAPMTMGTTTASSSIRLRGCVRPAEPCGLLRSASKFITDLHRVPMRAVRKRVDILK